MDTTGGEKFPRKVTAFNKAWKTACTKAGLPGRIPHDLDYDIPCEDSSSPISTAGTFIAATLITAAGRSIPTASQ